MGRSTGRTLYKDKSRDQGDASITQDCQRLLENHQELEESHGTNSSSQISKGINSVDTLISDF